MQLPFKDRTEAGALLSQKTDATANILDFNLQKATNEDNNYSPISTFETMSEKSETYGYINGGGPCPCAPAVLAGLATVIKQKGRRLIVIPRGWRGMQEIQKDAFCITDWTRSRLQQLIPAEGMPVATSRNKIRPSSGEQMEKFKKCWGTYGISGLISNGGDDTVSTGADLNDAGYPVIHVPKTIDDDISVKGWIDQTNILHQTYGWETAVNTVKERLLRLRTQIRSTERVGVGEVMGRKSGLLTYSEPRRQGQTSR